MSISKCTPTFDCTILTHQILLMRDFSFLQCKFCCFTVIYILIKKEMKKDTKTRKIGKQI